MSPRSSQNDLPEAPKMTQNRSRIRKQMVKNDIEKTIDLLVDFLSIFGPEMDSQNRQKSLKW